MEHWTLTLLERSYGLMLSLYPLEFRVRFRHEMAQVFRDSCRGVLRSRGGGALLHLWVRELFDLLWSISRERGRVLLDLRRLPMHARGLIDWMVIWTIIVFHLLSAGAGLAVYMPRSHETVRGFILVSAAMAAALGGFGVICSLVLARFRRVQCRLITL
jgi:hypothetical protein